MDQLIGFGRIFSEVELLRILQHGQIVGTRLKVFIPDLDNLSVALGIVRKIAKARLRRGGVFGMILDHPQYVSAKPQPVRGAMTIPRVIADERYPVFDLLDRKSTRLNSSHV